MEMTQTQWNALDTAIDAMCQNARRAENNGEPDVMRDLDDQISDLQDMLDSAEIVEPAAQPELEAGA